MTAVVHCQRVARDEPDGDLMHRVGRLVGAGVGRRPSKSTRLLVTPGGTVSGFLSIGTLSRTQAISFSWPVGVPRTLTRTL